MHELCQTQQFRNNWSLVRTWNSILTVCRAATSWYFGDQNDCKPYLFWYSRGEMIVTGCVAKTTYVFGNLRGQLPVVPLWLRAWLSGITSSDWLPTLWPSSLWRWPSSSIFLNLFCIFWGSSVKMLVKRTFRFFCFDFCLPYLAFFWLPFKILAYVS